MSEAFLYLNPDVCLRHVEGTWLASNPRLRLHVELNVVAAAVLFEQAAGASPAQWQARLQDAHGRDRSLRAVGAAGLHADHSGLAPAGGEALQGEPLLALLRRRCCLIASPQEARDCLAPLANLLDREHVGSFHQRVGQYLLVERRVREPWRAWQDQKFSPDGNEIVGESYRDIQLPFFDAWCTPARLAGKRVLDFGCGNGFFSARMAAAGAQVLGLDNSPELLELARRNHGKRAGLRFVETDSFEAVLDLLAGQEAACFAYIYLQDTLLLLLQPEQGERSPLLPDVFRALRAVLAQDGALCAMEPNPIFWLANRYGDPARPHAVVSEYFNPQFNVAPTLDVLLGFMAEAGFALAGYEHPRLMGGVSSQQGFQREFPIWDFFTFVPR